MDLILEELGQVAEGIVTTKTAVSLAKHVAIELPITQGIYDLLYCGETASNVMKRLLGRERKAERG